MLCLAVCAARPQAGAQTPAQLSIQIYAGISITGTVSAVYSMENVTDLAQTNDWRCLEFLQLPASPYLWTDKSVLASNQRFYRAVTMVAPTNMVFIPPGTFRMGSPPGEVDRVSDEGPQTAVTISRGFWMGKYLVTQADYQTLIGVNPSFFNGVNWNGYSNVDYGTDLTRPVESMSWNGATNYCALLTQQERTAGRIPTNCLYRLPTEAEWEYACRAWTSTRFSYGDDPGYANLTNYAWYGIQRAVGGVSHPVGQKLPNPWGLYDVHGNVWEWCQDGYDTYPGGIAFDPQGPSTTGYFGRVIRGGYFGNTANFCRSASRLNDPPDYSGGVIGFRIVLAPGQL